MVKNFNPTSEFCQSKCMWVNLTEDKGIASTAIHLTAVFKHRQYYD